MKRLFSRASLGYGLAAAAVAASVIAAPAAQAATFVPSPADFSTCPALPTGATKILWQCVSITLTSGSVKLGNISQSLASPIQFTIGVGIQNGKLTTLAGGSGGGSTGGTTIPGVGAVSIKVSQAGPVKLNGVLPAVIPIKVQVVQSLLGNNCFIGTDTAPITIEPAISGLGLTTSGTTPVISATVSDAKFAVPAATGCGLLGGIVNAVIGLPSASGNNSFTVSTVIQVRNYLLGNVTASAAGSLR